MNERNSKLSQKPKVVRKLPHLRKVRKYKKELKSVNLRICDLRNLFADRPPFDNSFLFCIPAFKQLYRLLKNAGVPYMLNF